MISHKEMGYDAYLGYRHRLCGSGKGNKHRNSLYWSWSGACVLTYYTGSIPDVTRTHPDYGGSSLGGLFSASYLGLRHTGNGAKTNQWQIKIRPDRHKDVGCRWIKGSHISKVDGKIGSDLCTQYHATQGHGRFHQSRRRVLADQADYGTIVGSGLAEDNPASNDGDLQGCEKHGNGLCCAPWTSFCLFYQANLGLPVYVPLPLWTLPKVGYFLLRV